MVFRLPCMILKIIVIQWKETYTLCYIYLIHSAWVGGEWVRSDNYFSLESLQKQSLSRRKTRRKKNFGEERRKKAKNFPSSPSCPLPEFCSSDGFYSGTVSNNYFLAQKNPKEICPTWSFLMNVLKGNHQHCLRSVFIQNGGKSISAVCDDDSSVGKVLSKTNLLVN